MLYVESHGARHHGSVEQATQGPWSSVSHHLGRWRDPLIVLPRAWWALGHSPFEREAAWRGRLEAMLSPAVVERITQASRRGWPIGDEAFLAHLAPLLGRPVVPRPRGRPARRQPELP
jgi:putative transposase